MNPREALDELEAVLRRIAAADPQLKYDVEVYASNVPATMTSPENNLIRACLRARELVLGQKQVERCLLKRRGYWMKVNV
ncbi:MAG: hypothetical protein HYY81_10105 [Deltaproteobacteria bacterium]|nr:hypothetical protein [Deltaproteobacteria bacterium]